MGPLLRAVILLDWRQFGVLNGAKLVLAVD